MILKVNISHLIQICLISVVSFELGLGAKIILCIDLSQHNCVRAYSVVTLGYAITVHWKQKIICCN